MTNRQIYDRLRAAGMTAEGACGMLGNMAAESAMRPDNAQDSYGIPDSEYVEQVNAGARDFVTDGVGFGLCQWTAASRKRKLLTFARARGVSIADPEMQTDFVIKELTEEPEFADVRRTLFTSHDLMACTQIVLNVYENPAVKNLGTRLEYAQMAYDDFGKGGGKIASVETKPDPVIMALQMVMSYAGYGGNPTGYRSKQFLEDFKEFSEYVYAEDKK